MAHRLSHRELVDQLAAIVTPRADGDDAFICDPTPKGAGGGAGRIFGGQVIAQALAAAEATVPDDRPVHSLHAYFLRMGSDDLPLRHQVQRDLDGRSFSNRRVTSLQDDRLLLSLSASFHRREESIAHQDDMPDVPGPEGLASDTQLRLADYDRLPAQSRDFLTQDRALELRTVEQLPWFDPEPLPPITHTWMRVIAPLGDDQRLHRALLAYATDMSLMRTVALPHALSWFSGKMMDASLDHALWFHDDFRIDEWLLYQTTSHWSGNGRGMAKGKIWTRDGRLIASVAQEGMIRLLKRD